jgi:ABC-type glutathione transport system ATPase component
MQDTKNKEFEMTDLSLGRHANIPSPPNHNQDINPQAVLGAEIIIEQLHKFYGSVKVLEDLDLHIQPGEFLAIVGRSGCGKSTLLRLIANLEQQSYGEIKFKSARHLREGITADDIRVMFQDPRLLPWRSIEQNVQLGLPKQQHATASGLLEKVGLKEKAGLWPSQLSGGQRQRTALARALSHKPRILLLDEPFNKPRKSPKPPPTNRPSKARPALTCTCFHSSPLSSRCQKALTTAVGAGKIRLSKSPVLEAICQSTIKPIGKSQGSNSCPN